MADMQSPLYPVLYEDEDGHPQLGWASIGLNNSLRRKAGQTPQLPQTTEITDGIKGAVDNARRS